MTISHILPVALLMPVCLHAEALCDALHQGDASLNQAGATCFVSQLMDGGEQHSCHWEFAYRTPEAAERLEQLRQQIEACLGSDKAMPADDLVNHPDSYILHRFEGQGRRVALSLKDKAAQNRTLIFVHLSTVP